LNFAEIKSLLTPEELDLYLSSDLIKKLTEGAIADKKERIINMIIGSIMGAMVAAIAMFFYMQNKIDEVLDKVGMRGFANQMPHQLSGGEQQRVAIARALLNDPEFILADEPTGNLDPQTSAEVLEVLKNINANGKTVIMATHDYALLMKFPSKTLKCEDGSIFEVIQRSV